MRKHYPSDLTDGEWEYLTKILPKQSKKGRPATHSRRDILNAIFYLTRTGCAWRYLPKEYPPWKTVYHYFRKWRVDGVWKRVNKQLRRLLRKRKNKHPQASLAILDSRSVKTTDVAKADTVGYDSGKKVKGRKHHILVDTLGLVIAVVVHAANISETAGARLVLEALKNRFWRLKKVIVDGGYQASLPEWAAGLERWRKVIVEWVLREPDQKGFAVLPKRWIVERTFGWMSKHRRLSKDYEALAETSEAMIYVVMIRVMVSQLSR
jgi:putative transposase